MTESEQIKKGCMIVIPRLSRRDKDIVGYDIKFTTEEEPTTLTKKELDEIQEIRERLESEDREESGFGGILTLLILGLLIIVYFFGVETLMNWISKLLQVI